MPAFRSASLVVLAFVILGGASAGTRPVGDVDFFADVPAPGFPEGIVARGGVAWVGTPASLTFGLGLGPSKLVGYDMDTAAVVREIEITGEDFNAQRGLSGMRIDAHERIYVLNVQAGLGVLRVDPDAGTQERYAAIPDVPPCLAGSSPCSPTITDRPAFPNDLVFDAHGNLYVSDSMQATIWRVEPGTRRVSAWFQDARLEGLPLGPNGIEVTPDGARIVFSLTFASPTLASGVYALPLVESPRESDLALYAALGEGPDNLRFGASGTLYAVLAGSNQVAFVAPGGAVTARHPDVAMNLLAEHPLDMPAAAEFRDATRSILVTNHALALGSALPERFEVLDMFVDDVAAPRFAPNVP